MPLEGNRILTFGIELHGVEVIVHVLGNHGIGESGLVHALAPAAPVGVDVDEDHLGLLGAAFDGFLKAHPLDLFLCKSTCADEG